MILQAGNGSAQFDRSLVLFDALEYDPVVSVILVVGTYALLFSTSGTVVRRALQRADIAIQSADRNQIEDTGTVIGKTENVLVLTLMLFEAYTALGIIFAAKSIVRRGDMGSEDTSYYLTGTLANFTYSVGIGAFLHLCLWSLVRFAL